MKYRLASFKHGVVSLKLASVSLKHGLHLSRSESDVSQPCEMPEPQLTPVEGVSAEDDYAEFACFEGPRKDP